MVRAVRTGEDIERNISTMAPKGKATATTVQEDTEPMATVENNNDENSNDNEKRTAPKTYGDQGKGESITAQGDNLMAAWPFLYEVLGARVERWDFDEHGHLVAVNMTVPEGKGYTTDDIVAHVSFRDRRVELYPAITFLQGEAPKPYSDTEKGSLNLTKDMQQYLRDPKDGAKSPEWAKDAIAEYKKSHSFPPKKGRPKMVYRVEELSKIDESLLGKLDATELDRLMQKLQHAQAAKTASAESAGATA